MYVQLTKLIAVSSSGNAGIASIEIVDGEIDDCLSSDPYFQSVPLTDFRQQYLEVRL